MGRKIAAFAILGPVMLIGLYRCTYLPLRCSRDISRSEAELVKAAERDDGYSKVMAARGALERLHHCYIRPVDVDPPLLTALSYRFLQRHDRAIEWYERALAIDRRPEIYLGLGLEQLKAGRREEGIENLTMACGFAPPMLDSIDDGVARQEVQRRIAARYRPDWLN